MSWYPQNRTIEYICLNLGFSPKERGWAIKTGTSGKIWRIHVLPYPDKIEIHADLRGRRGTHISSKRHPHCEAFLELFKKVDKGLVPKMVNLRKMYPALDEALKLLPYRLARDEQVT